MTEHTPEAFCDRCGRPNIRAWFSPEWNELVDRDDRERLILCPVCFADLDPGAVWKLTRQAPESDAVEVYNGLVLRGAPFDPDAGPFIPDLTDAEADAFQRAIDRH